MPTEFKPTENPFPLPANAKQNQKQNFLWKNPDGTPLWVTPDCVDESGYVHCIPQECSECQLKAATVDSNTGDLTNLLVVGGLLGAVILGAVAMSNSGQKTGLTPLPPEQVANPNASWW